MKLRALTLAGAALSALLLAGPTFAADSNDNPDPYHTNPTPAERAQTDQLNAGAAARAQNDADANDAAHRDYDASRAQYERDRAMSQADRAAYERDLARHHDDRADYSHRWDAFYGHERFRDVMVMREGDLMGLDVSTRGGNRIGRIRDVDSGHNGRITRVAVSTGHGNVAWIDADDLRFDPSSRTVMTDLTRDQVNGMAHMRYPRF